MSDGHDRHGNKSNVGRPTALTEESARTILAAIEAGNYLETAAALAGVTARTLRNWIRGGKGRRAEPLNGEFAQAFARAMANAEADNVEAILRDGSWQSRAWLLERRHPKRWARRNRPEAKEKPMPQPSMNQVIREINEVLGEPSVN